MRALTVQPGLANSVQLEDVPAPPASEGDVLVDALALGICGTDREILSGAYGWPPPGQKRLILGHESLGRVAQAPAASGFKRGDLVVGIVRRPDPVPCPACAVGEWDMCRNGQYTERGIKQRNGYGSEQFRVEHDFLVKLDPSLDKLGVLMEPTSIVAKAWEFVERFAKLNAYWQPKVALVTGAGPVGLLAALIGQQHGYEMHVMDRHADGPKPKLARALGATYHNGDLGDLEPDIVIECTGAGSVVLDVLRRNAPTEHRLPHRRLLRRPQDRFRRRRLQPRHGAGERPRLRHRQRQPPPLPRRGGGPRQGRQGLALRAHHPPRAARSLARGA